MMSRARLLLLIIVSLCAFDLLATSVRIFPLGDKVRRASVVAFGRTVALDDASISVDVDEVLKGAVSQRRISILWDRNPGFGIPVAKHAVGDHLVLFLTGSGSTAYEPIAGRQGSEKIGKGLFVAYRRAIGSMLRLEAASSATAKTAILIEMLSDSSISQLAAEDDLIAGRQRPIVHAELVQPLLNVARTGDVVAATSAVSYLSSLIDASTAGSMPEFIDLLASPNTNVASAAHHALTDMGKSYRWPTVNIPFDGKQDVATRRRAANEWRLWWENTRPPLIVRQAQQRGTR